MAQGGAIVSKQIPPGKFVYYDPEADELRPITADNMATVGAPLGIVIGDHEILVQGGFALDMTPDNAFYIQPNDTRPDVTTVIEFNDDGTFTVRRKAQS